MTKGERIKYLREKTGKTQTAFADLIGVSKQTLYKYESDIITNVPSDKIEAIASTASVSPAFVMGWEPEYSKNDLKTLEKLEPEQIELLKAYNNAPENIKDGVRAVLGIEK